MKKLRRLTKGIVGDIVAVAVVMILLLILWICIGEQPTYDVFFLKIVVYLFLVALLLAGGAVYLVLVICTYNKARKRLMVIPGFSEERFEREIERAPQFRNILCCCDAICYTGMVHIIKVIPIVDIIWAYQEQTGNVLQIYTRGKEKHTVTVDIKGKRTGKKGEAGSRYLLRLIARKNKNALIGYEESYEEMYKKDFERLLMQTYGRVVADSGQLEQEYVENDYYHKDFQ